MGPDGARARGRLGEERNEQSIDASDRAAPQLAAQLYHLGHRHPGRRLRHFRVGRRGSDGGDRRRRQPAAAQPADAPAAGDEDIVVTGIRASLRNAANAKRDNVGFSESVFADDIGDFPDTNLAESFNRVPGITITRETTGEGLNIAIRGLGTNFTRILLNGAPVAIASTGRTDSQNTNREVDLDLFPSELFTQLTVSKSPLASMIEGGAAGTVNMRTARPFDNPGLHINYPGCS